jgi:hypothetical protein
MKKKIFSMLVLLMTAVTGAWADETPLVTIESKDYTSFKSGSMTFDDKVTVTFSNTVKNYGDTWGWYCDMSASLLTVAGINGNTITSCKFYAGDGTADYTVEGESPSVYLSGSKVYTDDSKSVNIGSHGVTKIEVYGYAAAPAATTNYYLVGTMNDWGASKQFLLTPNPGNAAEYMITLNLKADTQLKVIGVEEGKETVWYPSGDNYYVNTAGQYTVYFRPDGQGGEGWHYGCIYLAPAPAPAVPLTDLGSGQWQFEMPDYAVVAKIEYDTELELQEENVNTTVLADWDGYEADITLQRTLVAGSWNTLAVPFNVSSQMLTALNGLLAAQGGSLTVKKLANTTLSGETILLNFENATEIEAGKPYLVKVTKDVNLASLSAAIDAAIALGQFSANPFHDAEISKDPVPVETQYADFIPTLGKTTIDGVSADDVLFVAAGNTLKNPGTIPTDMKGFRAYFLLKNVPTEARGFALNLGDESTGIESLTASPMGEGSIYDLQGRKANAAQKGVYIVNGKKVIK